MSHNRLPSIDRLYCELLNQVLTAGSKIRTRNADCRRIFLLSLSSAEFPLISVRKTTWKNSLREWEWFMSGSSNIEDLHPAVHSWWKPWADKNGRVANNYSEQFRLACGGKTTFGSGVAELTVVDQLEKFIDGVKNHPYSRRNVMTTWNGAEMWSPETPITNCHGTVIQAFVEPDNRLYLATYQRSVDVVCGLPHNLTQYWAFLIWLAHRTGRDVGSLTWIGGDIHLYECHVPLVKKIFSEVDRAGHSIPQTPQLFYTPSSEDFKADDFKLSDEYYPLLSDRAEMVV